MALVGAGSGLVNLTDIGAFGVKGRIWFWRQPVTKAVRFKVGLFCVFQRRAYGLRDEEYLRLKVLTCMLPAL